MQMSCLDAPTPIAQSLRLSLAENLQPELQPRAPALPLRAASAASVSSSGVVSWNQEALHHRRSRHHRRHHFLHLERWLSLPSRNHPTATQLLARHQSRPPILPHHPPRHPPLLPPLLPRLHSHLQSTCLLPRPHPRCYPPTPFPHHSRRRCRLPLHFHLRSAQTSLTGRCVCSGCSPS